MPQVASREFETEFRKLLAKSHPKVAKLLLHPHHLHLHFRLQHLHLH